jgi:hypothetical protein
VAAGGSIKRQENRLRRLFTGILFGTVATPAGVVIAAGACSTKDQAADSVVDACVPLAVDYDAPVSHCAPGQGLYCDAAAPCDTFVLLPCGPPTNTEARSSCFLSPNDCSQLCPGAPAPYACVTVGDWCADGAFYSDRGPAILECNYCLNITGRRPAGLRPVTTRQTQPASDVVGDYLARASHLEAASIIAFGRLARELREHAAPRELVAGAQRAARDEIRHARVMARLARARRTKVPRASVTRVSERSFAVMLLENAIEGCVRETFGALVAHWQAAHAGDPEIASAMQRIAVDETRHAALAWAIAEWASERTTPAERAAVSAARSRATKALWDDSGAAKEPRCSALGESAGLPSAAMQRAWLFALDEQLWAIS